MAPPRISLTPTATTSRCCSPGSAHRANSIVQSKSRSQQMPKYAALLYRLEGEQPEAGTPTSQQLYQAWGAFNRDVREARVLTSGTGLQPSATATSVRVREGKTLITDGPFAETREQLGGILL